MLFTHSLHLWFFSTPRFFSFPYHALHSTRLITTDHTIHHCCYMLIVVLRLWVGATSVKCRAWTRRSLAQIWPFSIQRRIQHCSPIDTNLPLTPSPWTTTSKSGFSPQEEIPNKYQWHPNEILSKLGVSAKSHLPAKHINVEFSRNRDNVESPTPPAHCQHTPYQHAPTPISNSLPLFGLSRPHARNLSRLEAFKRWRCCHIHD